MRAVSLRAGDTVVISGAAGGVGCLAVQGRLEVPIATVYPMSEVRAAYRELEQRHTLGKIVLRPA